MKENKIKSLQLKIDEEVINILKREKKLQGRNMSKIVEELIIDNYATPKEKLKRM